MGDARELNIQYPSHQKRGAWYLLTGVILGLIMGILYAWVINPAIYEHTSPASLDDFYKDFYYLLIAQSYASTGNLERARLRLELLNDEDPFLALGAQAQRAQAAGNSKDAHALALLASSLQNPPVPQSVSTIPGSGAITSTATMERVPTQTLPIPTATP